MYFIQNYGNSNSFRSIIVPLKPVTFPLCITVKDSRTIFDIEMPLVVHRHSRSPNVFRPNVFEITSKRFRWCKYLITVYSRGVQIGDHKALFGPIYIEQPTCSLNQNRPFCNSLFTKVQFNFDCLYGNIGEKRYLPCS